MSAAAAVAPSSPAQQTEAVAPTPAASAAPAVSVGVAPTVTSTTPVAEATPGPISAGRPARTSLDWRALASMPGVTFSAEEITDASSGTGAMSSAHALRTHSDFAVTLDFEKLMGWSGLTVYAQHKTKTGRNGSGEASFVQNYSNIDADNFRSLGEVFVEQRAFDDRLRVKVGRIDFNSEFAGTDNGGGFLNASMGYSPSIAAAPTFPLPSNGLNVFITPREHLTLAVGVFDGLDGAPAAPGHSSQFQIAQANQTWSLGSRALPGRVGVGYFRHTGLFLASSDADDVEPHLPGTHGLYGTLDQTLWQGAPRSSEDGAARPSIAAFVQLGNSDRNVQAVNAHSGGGLTFSGLWARRSSDVFGLGFTNASWQGGGELISEMYYQLPVLSHLSLMGDWQAVRRSEAGANRWMGSVLSMRTIVSF